MQDIVLALSALFAFLLPISIYCLILAFINRRPRPMLVNGMWDSVGLLFAASGFFLVTLPMLFHEFYMRTLDDGAAEHFSDVWLRHWILWMVYYLLIISGAALMLLWRGHKTMIYNVDPDQFPRALETAMANVGLVMAMQNDRLVLTPSHPASSVESTEFTQVPVSSATATTDVRYAEMSVESFSSMCHISLHWDNYEAGVRRQIEHELERSLESSAPLDNAAAGWFLTISGMIFGALFVLVVMFFLLVFLAKR